MKALLGLSAAALLLASNPAAHARVSETLPGKIGPLTLALTLTTEAGGYPNGNYERVISSTRTLTKSVLVRTRYTNTQFIADLLNRYELPGVPADYTLQFVTANNGFFSGFFLTNANRSIVRYIGTTEDQRFVTISSLDSEFPYDDDKSFFSRLPLDLSNAFSQNDTLFAESGSITTSRSGPVTTTLFQSSYTSVTPGTNLYLNPLAFEDGFTAYGLINQTGTYRGTSTINTQTEEGSFTDTFTVGPTQVTGIIGSDFDEVLLTGSASIAALAETADVTVFYQAYLDYQGDFYGDDDVN